MTGSDNSTIEDFKKNKSNSNALELPKKIDRGVEIAEKSPNEKDIHNSIFMQYSRAGNSFIPCGRTVKKLKSGSYKIGRTDNGLPIFEPAPIRSDEWLNFRDDLIESVLDEVQKFWDRRKIFEDYGYLQKRGYMFYGPAGTGKTVLIKQLIQKMIQQDGIVFICDGYPETIQNGLKHFSSIEPERNIICVFEDIDAIIDRYGESDLLCLLDGEDSVDHVLNLATTNYPEKLDRRIVGRPRRFDRIIKINYPDADMRGYYFSEKLKIDGNELDEWVKHTENFTFAALTELVISVKCLGNEFDKSVQRIRDLLEIKVSSDEYKVGKRIGFTD